jgi:hypothetical protein
MSQQPVKYDRLVALRMPQALMDEIERLAAARLEKPSQTTRSLILAGLEKSQ